jgi:transcriptional regulator with XRE-family HTH domain
MKTAELIAHERTDRGLSQGALALRAGTSRERINSYERGHVYPTSDTLERLLGALDAELLAIPVLTFEERRSLAISTAVARRLLADPVNVMTRARVNLSRMRDVATHEHRWLDVWDSMLGLGPSVVAGLLMSPDPFARDLRQSSPFAGVLTEAERADSIRGLRR